MRKFEKHQIIRNVASSQFALAVNIVVGILLSPFILHRLGDAAFGIWVLIFSITGYYGLFDLGIRSSVVRYVSKYVAVGDNEQLARLVNTSLFTYTCIAGVTFALTLAIAPYVNVFFRIPPEFHSTARILLLMVGASVALGFPLGIVGGFLEGLQRFDILNATNILATLLRAALIVVALGRGRGLLTIALITVILPLLTSVVRAVIAFRIRSVTFGWKYVDRGTFREMANYSGATLMIIIAGRLKFKTDEIVIGSMLSAAAITYFNVGARIVDYAGEVVVGLAQVFVPMSSEAEATGKIDRLRRIFIVGNRFCAFTIFPICAILIILGKSIIEVWVGKKYIAESYPVLVIMILPCTLWYAQGASGRVLFGMGRHGTWAKVTLIEGVCNLILSVLLVRPYGIVGDAFGTAIPLTCSMLLFMPQHLCRRLVIPVRTFVREAYLLPALLTVPLILTLLLLRHWFVAHHYLQLAIQLAIGGAVYGLCLLWAFLTNRALRAPTFPAISDPTANSSLPVPSAQ